jgi:oligosaccharide 4-alpha-D-glucosyltransferase
MSKLVQNTQNYVLNDFDVHYYFDASTENSKLNLYNDDGITPSNFENLNYEKFDFRSKFKNNVLKIKVDYDKAINTTNSKKINLIIHGFNKKPSTVNLNKKQLKISSYKFENNLIIISLDCEIDVTNEIEIKL